MKKYKVRVYTTCPDLCPECVMDEFALNECLDFSEADYLQVEDDTKDITLKLNMDHVVGIEWELIS